jgi:ABC-type sugar transport system ATPase subunit
MTDPTSTTNGNTGATATPVTRMRGITKHFPGIVALDDVDLTLYPGEVHALTGENGSGKSTLAKILYGALQPDAGTIAIDGAEHSLSSPAAALERGIVAINQEVALAPTLSVTENILMGRVPRTRLGRLDWAKARRMAGDALERVGVEIAPDRRVADLTIELQQQVEIARAVSIDSRVLILDEATSSLSEAAAAQLLRIVEQLRRANVAVLMISHRMPELYGSCTRATVLRDGRRVDEVPLPQTPEHEVVRLMVGRELGDLYHRRETGHGEPVLTVRGLQTLDGTLKPVSFEVRRGEIVGVAGLVGSGKAEVGLALAGAVPSDGEVLVNGRPADVSSPLRAIRAGIGFVPDDRKRSALLPNRSVQENLSCAWGSVLTRGGVIDARQERRMAVEAIDRFGISTRSPTTLISALSGGNQQKVVLGRWFELGLDVLVLSEPTRGIDVGAKSDVYRLIQEMAANGAAILMISSELPELLGVADRILVMFHGELRAKFDAAGAEEEAIAHVAVAGVEYTSA